jgi:uncharacterized hydrophobic protein (TIGR00341 family)
MALRLIEMVLPEKDGADVRELLEGHNVIEHRQVQLSDGEVLVRILLDAEQSEAVLNVLEKRNTGGEINRIVVLPVEASLPRADPEPVATPADAPPGDIAPQRISREELYEDIRSGARCTRVYLVMAVLSTLVAAFGLYYDSVAILIGAMVIAPLLGTALGDLSLLRRALLTSLTGIATTMVLSVVLGVMLQANPASPELASRNAVAMGDIVVALASGSAGVLAFTTGVSTALIGVMVAVALLPPLVTFGLLLGGGHPTMAAGALSLFLVNLICVNLAGVITFLAQGIQPATWWEKERAASATRIAIGLWVALLAASVGAILLLRKG